MLGDHHWYIGSVDEDYTASLLPFIGSFRKCLRKSTRPMSSFVQSLPKSWMGQTQKTSSLFSKLRAFCLTDTNRVVCMKLSFCSCKTSTHTALPLITFFLIFNQTWNLTNTPVIPCSSKPSQWKRRTISSSLKRPLSSQLLWNWHSTLSTARLWMLRSCVGTMALRCHTFF